MTEHTIELGDVLASIPGILSLFVDFKSENKGATFGEFVKQRMPGMFGFSKADEQIYLAVEQLVSATKWPHITALHKEMKPYESDNFRLVLAGMSPGKKLVDKPVKPQKGQQGPQQTVKEAVSLEFTDEDLRVKYLGALADQVASSSAKDVVEALRARRLIVRSELAEQFHEAWGKSCKWVKENILEFFELDPDTAKLTDIKVDMLVQKLNAGTIWLKAERLKNDAQDAADYKKRKIVFVASWAVALILATIIVAIKSN